MSEVTRTGVRLVLLAVVAIGVAIEPAAADPSRAAASRGGLADSVMAGTDEMIRIGRRFNDAGDYHRALAWWWRWVAIDPTHPAPHIQATETLYWMMVHDDDTRFDRAIEFECGLAISKAERFVRANPEDARAQFYHGQALMQLGRLRGIRLQIYQAGKLGEDARESLERTLELDPEFVDARFQLGMYYYYASLVPSLVQWFSWLWFIPTGDADVGLGYLEQVWEKGDLYRFSAGFFLANIMTYHPGRLNRPRALELISTLHEEVPTNALVHFELLELLAMQGRHADVIREARQLEANPLPGRETAGRRNMARIWRARSELMLGDPDEAWRLLEGFGAGQPTNPNWGAPWVVTTRGQILDVAGRREEAVAQYAQVLALGLDMEEYRAARLANEGMETPFRLRVESPVAARPEIGANAPFDSSTRPDTDEDSEETMR